MPARWMDYMLLDDLQRAPRNPKNHASDLIAKSLSRHGYVEPITLDERTGRLVAGHGRLDDLEARRAKGEAAPDGVEVRDGAWFVPVARGWSSKDDAQAAAYLVTSNQTTIAGGWDMPELVDVLSGLAEVNVDELIGTGFGTADIDDLIASLQPKADPVALNDPDAVPEPPVAVRTKRGDVWLLGEHRVMCGDASSVADHDMLLAGERVDAVITDPPYGVGIDYGEMTDDSETVIRELVLATLPLLVRHPVVLLTSGHRLMWDYPKPMWLLGWVHPAGMGSGPWGFTCLNPVLAYGRDPYLARQLGRRADVLVLAADREGETDHPVSKPLKVWEWLMLRGSPAEGETILDPFLGSGTTLIAAHRLRRRCLGMELEPRWVDVALRRFQEHTGIIPILEATGEPHDFTVTNPAKVGTATE